MGKKKCPEFENHERWLVAFGDMMTLLFALFVVLYSIANVEIKKLKKVKQSIQKAFGVANVTTREEGGIPKGKARSDGIFMHEKGNTKRKSFIRRHRRELAAIIEADYKKMERRLSQVERLYGDKKFPGKNEDKKKERLIYVNRDPDGIRVSLLARHFFKAGQYKIDKKAWPILHQVAESVKTINRPLRVEGHTDSSHFAPKNGMSNWELSASRAASVVRFFVNQHGYKKKSLYVAGFADTRPVAPNNSPQNRALNRRVDLRFLYDTPKDLLPPDTAGEVEAETYQDDSD